MLGCLDKSPARLEILQMRDVNELHLRSFQGPLGQTHNQFPERFCIRAMSERLARRERTPSTEGEHAFSQCKIPIQ